MNFETIMSCGNAEAFEEEYLEYADFLNWIHISFMDNVKIK